MTYTKKELKKYLKGLLKENDRLASFSFEYKSGHTAYHTRLRIILTSDKIIHWKIPRGTPTDVSEEDKVVRKREISFSVEKMFIFVQEIVKRKIWDLENCTERALPDDAMLTFLIKDGQETLFERNVWEICRNDDKRTKELIRAIAAHIPSDWTPP